MKIISMRHDEMMDLADSAANHALAYIQEKMGIESGDFASLYFSGDRWLTIVQILYGYIISEIMESKK